MRYSILLQLLLCISVLTGYSSHAQQYIFKKYTVEDGLVSNPVRRIYQDKKGFIWIGTWEGLSKYDGHKFTNYTIANGLSHNLVNDMVEMADGKLYVAENNGSIDIIEHDAIVKKISFPRAVFNRFCTIKNQLIAVTDSNGIYEIRNGQFTKPSQAFPDSAYSDCAEINDSLLVGGSDGNIDILHRNYQLLSQIKQPKELVIFKIYKDSKNIVWLGTNYGLKYLSYSQKLRQPPVFSLLQTTLQIPELAKQGVNDMLEDSNGNFWIATLHGLVKIYPDGSWQILLEKNWLLSSNISCIYEDKEKNIWIGTYLGVAKLVTKNNIRTYNLENESTPQSYGFLILLNRNEFLINTGAGIHLYNKKVKKFFSIKSQNNLSYTGFVQNSNPLLFFRNNNEFGKFDSAKRRIEYYILPVTPNSKVYCSIIDKDGIIFNGTQEGLIICRDKLSYYEIKFNHRITDMLIDKKGYLWVATWEKGVFRIQYNNIKNKPGNPGIHLSIQDFSHLLPDKNIRSLFEDSFGNIWVGTRYHGLVRFNKANDHNTSDPYDIKKGLLSNWIRVISEDARGNIWIGSNLGMDKLIPAGNTFRIFNFSRVNNYFANINAILPDENHSLWLSSNKGLVNITDEETEKNPPYRVYITSVNLADTSFDYNKHPQGSKVVLKYNQNQAAFEFSAPGFINEKQTLYSYRLTGSADTAWSKPTNVHNVSYASLQPGNYKFEVRTLSWNGKWGVAENFSFIIKPPYWKTWWFYSFIGLILLLLFYAFYLYRIRQLLRLQNVRNRIATDLHDDIGSTLTNINMLSEISRKNLGQPREAEKFLQRITEEVTATSQALNDIIWSVNSRNDSMEETLSRMRRYAAELFDNSNTNCHLHLDESIAEKKINMEQRRDIYLVYKELMNNIVKHASAQNVWVDAQLQNGQLRLIIKDDGKGFEPTLVTDRNGLKNIRLRINKWKGGAGIESRKGEGTTIEILIPLNE